MPALSRSPYTRAGLTLIEIIISAAIFIMLLTAVYESTVLAIHHYHKIRDASEIQGETLRVMSRIERALSDAAAETVTVNLSPLDPVGARYILFVSAESDNVYYAADPSDAAPMWQRFVCFYVEPGANGRYNLVRKDRTFPPTSTLPASLPTRDDMVNDSSLTPQVLTKNLTEVSFGDSTAIALKLGILSEQNNGLTLYTRITPRQ